MRGMRRDAPDCNHVDLMFGIGSATGRDEFVRPAAVRSGKEVVSGAFAMSDASAGSFRPAKLPLVPDLWVACAVRGLI